MAERSFTGRVVGDGSVGPLARASAGSAAGRFGQPSVAQASCCREIVRNLGVHGAGPRCPL